MLANESFEPGEYLDLPSKLKIHFLDALYTKCTQAEKPPLSKAAITKMDGSVSADGVQKLRRGSDGRGCVSCTVWTLSCRT